MAERQQHLLEAAGIGDPLPIITGQALDPRAAMVDPDRGRGRCEQLAEALGEIAANRSSRRIACPRTGVGGIAPLGEGWATADWSGCTPPRPHVDLFRGEVHQQVPRQIGGVVGPRPGALGRVEQGDVEVGARLGRVSEQPLERVQALRPPADDRDPQALTRPLRHASTGRRPALPETSSATRSASSPSSASTHSSL